MLSQTPNAVLLVFQLIYQITINYIKYAIFLLSLGQHERALFLIFLILYFIAIKNIMNRAQQTISENQSDLFPPKQVNLKQYRQNYHELESDLSENNSKKLQQQQHRGLHLPEVSEEQSRHKLKMPQRRFKVQDQPRAQTRHGRHGKILIEEKGEYSRASPTNNRNKIRLFNVEDELEEKEQSLIEVNDYTPSHERQAIQTIPIRITNQQPAQKVFEENNSNTFIKPIDSKKQILQTEEEPVLQKTPQLKISYGNSIKSENLEQKNGGRRAKLVDVATAKTAAMKKNLMQAQIEKEIQYVMPSIDSKASIQTGMNLQSSRDELSTRNMIESMSPVRKKRLANLKPMNEVMNRKEEKIYSLKTYDQLQSLGQRQKRMVVLDNGKFAILKQDIDDKRIFLYETIGFDKCLQTTITRNRGCSKFGYLDYDVETNDGQYLLSCKKMPFHLGSNYHISLSKGQFAQNSQYFAAKVQGNFTGSIFNVTSTLFSDVKARELSATICYSPEWLCCKVGFRQIEIYIKNKNFRYCQLEGSDDKKNLKQLYEFKSNRTFRKIQKYVNKQPKWLPDKQIYALNFRGKVKCSSVKNTIIVNAEDKSEQALLLAKKGPDTFALDIQYPFNPIIAMAVAMTSFDFKLATQ